MENIVLKNQEIDFDHPDSRNMFVPTDNKPFLATCQASQAIAKRIPLRNGTNASAA